MSIMGISPPQLTFSDINLNFLKWFFDQSNYQSKKFKNIDMSKLGIWGSPLTFLQQLEFCHFCGVCYKSNDNILPLTAPSPKIQISHVRRPLQSSIHHLSDDLAQCVLPAWNIGKLVCPLRHNPLQSLEDGQNFSLDHQTRICC